MAPSEQNHQWTRHLSQPWGLWGTVVLIWRVFPAFYPLVSISEILFFNPMILTFLCSTSTCKRTVRDSPPRSR